MIVDTIITTCFGTALGGIVVGVPALGVCGAKNLYTRIFESNVNFKEGFMTETVKCAWEASYYGAEIFGAITFIAKIIVPINPHDD